MSKILKMAWRGDLEGIKDYLADGGDPNHKQSFRSVNNSLPSFKTPLFCAVEHNGKTSFEIVSLLLKNGAEPDSFSLCTTPLVVATKNKNEKLIKLLKKAGAKTTDHLKLIQAIQRNASIPKKFLNEDFTIEEGGGTLHVVCGMGEVKAIKQGIKAGLDRNREDIFGNKPVHYLSLKKAAVFSLFKPSLLNVNEKDRYHRTLLHRATRGRNANAVKRLLKVGADPNIVSKKGSTPLVLAVQNTGTPGTSGKEQTQLDIINLLLDAGAVLHPKKQIAEKRLAKIRSTQLSKMVAETMSS